jgi:glycosyltransferase involved in cell wall biosynthesis
MLIPTRADLDPWVLFIAVTALVAALWTARAVPGTHRVRSLAESYDGLFIAGLAGAAASAAVYGVFTAVVPLLLFCVLATVIHRQARHLSMPGVAWLTIDFLGLVFGWIWGLLFINDLALPRSLEAVGMIGLTLTLAVSILGSIERIAREAVFTHQRWRRPIRALEEGEGGDYRPRVSIQLPCYAEPPEVVKETMNRLAALDYDNFEVLVCDNNTKDEALWRPLEAHAQVLNRRLGREVFRFFHVAPLPGAKAGALNWLLDGRIDPTAELIAVIDADYYSQPDFLSRLVPFFRSRSLAYLQTPHDYRDFEQSPYLSACYAEYMPNNKIDMLGVNEYGGAFTIGTMCILRTRVLRLAGGWAEWCLTEDSEISVRMRAKGYRGIYLGETFGRGLIPTTFDDYKKQRFRWTAGPVQQLRRHWKLFRPYPWARRMPGWTKLLEVLRCIAPLRSLAALATGMLVLAGIVVAALLGRMEPVDLPAIVWVLMPLAAATGLVRLWHRYWVAGIGSIGDMVRGEIARASLGYVVLVAGIAGLSSKPHAWRRTPKFGAEGSVGAALASVFPETIIGLAALAAAGGLVSLNGALGPELTALMVSGMAMMGLSFLCAPYMALLALRDIKRQRRAAEPSPAAPLPTPLVVLPEPEARRAA